MVSICLLWVTETFCVKQQEEAVREGGMLGYPGPDSLGLRLDGGAKREAVLPPHEPVKELGLAGPVGTNYRDHN